MSTLNYKKIFFSGIGGVGVSAAARLLHMQGREVLGSDAAENELIEQLRQEGIKVNVPQVADNISSDVDLFVYTVAVNADNPERQQAQELGIKAMTYPQLLGEMIADQYGIGISGTNGKTSTTALLGLIFTEANLDPSVILGGKAEYLGGNARAGQGKYFIFESDEYRRAFANYSPKMAVVTYVSVDHLDYYKDLNDIKSAFSDYLKRVPAEGFIFVNVDDKNSLEVVNHCSAQVISFGIDNSADIMAKNIRQEHGRQIFDLYYHGENLGQIDLFLPAKYNIYNVLAACGPALQVGIGFDQLKKSIANFKGSWRRFERLGVFGRTEVIADYAHTPDAVSETIAATKEFFPGKKVLAIFQPHQYSRTKNLFTQFTQGFGAADRAWVTDIFFVRGRENPEDFDVSGKKLAAEANGQSDNVEYVAIEDVEKYFENISQSEYDIILVLGAGDIYSRVKNILNKK